MVEVLMTQTGLSMSTAQERELQQVPLSWIRQELVSLAKLLSDSPAEPTAALIRVMKEDA
jgi:hypothetical protein